MPEISSPKKAQRGNPQGSINRNKLLFGAGYFKHGVEFQNLPWWRKFYYHKPSSTTSYAHVASTIGAVGGGVLEVFVPPHLLNRSCVPWKVLRSPSKIVHFGKIILPPVRQYIHWDFHQLLITYWSKGVFPDDVSHHHQRNICSLYPITQHVNYWGLHVEQMSNEKRTHFAAIAIMVNFIRFCSNDWRQESIPHISSQNVSINCFPFKVWWDPSNGCFWHSVNSHMIQLELSSHLFRRVSSQNLNETRKQVKRQNYR